MTTTNRTIAGQWLEALAPIGVEGIVARGLSTYYRPDSRRAWLKVRHAETTDVPITGTLRRPRTALLQLPDGRRRQTPQLDAVQARAISDALTVQEPPRSDPQETGLLVLSVPLAAEARVGTSHRHSTIRFARVKADQ